MGTDCRWAEGLLRDAGAQCWIDQMGLSVDGWLSQSFTWNPDSPANRFNNPVSFNDRSNEYMLNQLYLRLARQVDTQSNCWDIGGQVDLLYGTDYFFTTATGLETKLDGTQRWNDDDGPRNGGTASIYGLAMPQLYAEIFAPIGNGLRVKLGHFYTIVGYETVTAPDNFFFSHSYTMRYGEPFTHTGALASYQLAPNVTVHGGLTRGWDNWEDTNDDMAFLGGVKWTSCDGLSSLAMALHTGDEDAAGDNNRTVYSMVFAHHLSQHLQYVFQHDFGIEENAEFVGADTDAAKWYGINQYLLYTLSPTTAYGVRLEWFRDQDNARVLGIPFQDLVEGANYFAITLGMNWRPHQCITVRPELRWDWSNVEPPLTPDGMFDDFSDKNQFTLGTDVIVRF